MLVAEAIDAVLASQIGLLLAYFGEAKVIKAQVCRVVGLVVVNEKRLSLYNISPFSESL